MVMKSFNNSFKIPSKGALNNLKNRVFDILFPPVCFITGDRVESWGAISPRYWKNIAFIAHPFCDQCSVPFDFAANDAVGDIKCPSCMEKSPAFDKSRAAMRYDEYSRRIILPFKHGDQTHLVRSIALWMGRAGEDLIDKTDIFVPVPLHRTRLWKRRYNQSLIIAERLAKNHKKGLMRDGLKRIKATAPQGHKKKKERFDNVKDAFSITPLMAAQIHGKTICLVDDVFTTGATLNECARVLKQAGAAHVFTLCLARTAQ